MVTKRSEAKEIITTYQKLFEDIKGKPCILTFDRHKAEDVIPLSLELANTTGRVNTPNKRVDTEGKNRSPMIFEVKTDQCTLVFAIDDTQVAGLGDGLRFTIKGIRADIIVDLRVQ